MNGRPVGDEAPQNDQETDIPKEETFIDALDLQLRHNVTEIYVPVVGGQLALNVRRNAASEIWNLANGLLPRERKDRPFGSGWTTGVIPHIDFVTQRKLDATDPCKYLDPDYAYVTDEHGSVFRFVLFYVFDPNDPQADPATYYFPLPSNIIEQDTRRTSLRKVGSGPDGQGIFEFKKSYGTTLLFKYSGITQTINGSRNDKFSIKITHRYYHIQTVTDRFGSVISYTVPDNTLIPTQIVFQDAGGINNQKLQIATDPLDPQRIKTIIDPRGNTYIYSYETRQIIIGNPDTQYTILKRVDTPEGVFINYEYDAVEEPDTGPATLHPTPFYHVNLSQISKPLDLNSAINTTYSLSYSFDHKRKYFDPKTSAYYDVLGQPRSVTHVTLPESGSVSLQNNAYMRLKGGGTIFEGYRGTLVTDAAGNSRSYEFRDVSVHFLSDFDKWLHSTHFGENPICTPKLVVFSQTSIAHYSGNNVGVIEDLSSNSVTYFPQGSTTTVGTESYTFELEAGMALSKATDFFGNDTLYEHADVWSYSGLTVPYVLNRYPEPTKRTNALGFIQLYRYANDPAVKDLRLVDLFTDEEGRQTLTPVDSLGRRTLQQVSDPLGTVKQLTSYEYTHIVYPAFVTKTKIVAIPGQSDPTWVTNLETVSAPDTYGRLAQQRVDPQGLNLTTTHAYDLNNNLTATWDPNANAAVPIGDPTEGVYDNLNRIKEKRFPRVGIPLTQYTKTFKYNWHGALKEEVNENGKKVTSTFDGRNRVKSTTVVMSDPTKDLTTQYSYNQVDSRIATIDPNGNTFSKEYDAIQRLTKEIDALSKVTQYVYGNNCGGSAFDTSGFRPTQTIDPRGFVRATTYDALHRLCIDSHQYIGGGNPRTARVELTYDKVGNQTQKRIFPNYESDPTAFQLTSTTFDALNRPIVVTHPDGTTNLTNYATTGFAWQHIDELARAITHEFDKAGREIKTTLPPVDDGTGQIRNPESLFSFDRNGNTIVHTDPRGNSTTTEYDARNRKTKETRPSVSGGTPITQWEYDGVGNRIAEINPRGKRTDFYFDEANREVEMRGPAPQPGQARPITKTTYDKNGNVVQKQDPNNHITLNQYDARNLLRFTTDPVGYVVEFRYDDSRNRIEVIDGNGHSTQFGFDGLNRNTETRFIAAPAPGPDQVTTITFDALRKIRRTDAMGQVTEYSYDPRNRLTAETFVGRPADNREYTYDAVGNILAVEESHATKQGKADVFCTYDNLNRVVTEQSNGVIHSTKYDLNGNLVKTVLGTSSRIVSKAYDVLNRVSTISEGGRTTTYAYDLNGNIVTQQDPNGQVTAKTYDDLDRLVASQHPAVAYTVTHDLVGNVTSIAEQYPANASLNRTVVNIYDNNDRLLSETATKTVGGAQTVTTYQYDAANNRTQMTKNGVVTNYTINSFNQIVLLSGPSAVAFVYDANGNRIQRVENQIISQTYSYDYENRLVNSTKNGLSYDYTYDFRRRRVERVEDGSATRSSFSGGLSVQDYQPGSSGGPTSSWTLVAEYIRGPNLGGGIGGLLYSLRAGIPSYNSFNHRGDLTTKTGNSGSVLYQATYDAFGNRPDVVGSTPDRQRANTKEEDPTGLLNEGMRYRDLETGSYITRDPAGLIDGPNLYTYVRQNPWTSIDPVGLWGWGTFALALGTAILGAVVVAVAVSGVGAAAAAVALAVGASAQTAAVAGTVATGIVAVPLTVKGGLETGVAIRESLTDRDAVTGEGLPEGRREVQAANAVVGLGALGIGARSALKARGSDAKYDAQLIDNLIEARKATIQNVPPKDSGNVTLSTGQSQGRFVGISESVPDHGPHAEQLTMANMDASSPTGSARTIAVDQNPCKKSCLPMLQETLPPGSRVIVPRTPEIPRGSPKTAAEHAARGTRQVVPDEIMRIPTKPGASIQPQDELSRAARALGGL